MSPKFLRAACWLPFCWLAWYIGGLDPQLPLFDQWTFGQFYHAVAMGEAGWQDFLAPHNNSHPIVFARLVLTPIALATDLNFKAEIWLCLLVVMAMFFIMGRMLDRAGIGDTPAALTARFMSAVLLCSPVIYWPWVWSNGFFHFSINLAIVAAAWLLIPDNERPSRGRNVVLAMACCAVASTTRAEGLASWGILAPAAFVYTKALPHRARWRTAWLSGALLCGLFFVYSFGFLREASSLPLPGASSMAGDLWLSSLVALGLIGRPLGAGLQHLAPAGIPDPRVFMPLGAALVFAFGWLSGSHFKAKAGAIRNVALAWIGVGVYGLSFAGAATLARVSLLESNLFGDFWPMMYSATTVMVFVAVTQLGALRWSAARRGAMSALERRSLIGASLAAAALLLAGYGALGPSALAKRAQSVDSGDCWELIPHLAQSNLCFVNLPSTDIVDRFAEAGFRHVRTDVVKLEHTSGESAGRLEPLASPQEGVLNHRVEGRVQQPPEGGRPSVFIEVDGKLFGQAVVERETAEQWRFVGQIHWSGPDPARVRAFLYQREAGRLLPLPGEMTLGADEDETQ